MPTNHYSEITMNSSREDKSGFLRVIAVLKEHRKESLLNIFEENDLTVWHASYNQKYIDILR